jgi:hypothetical protein
MFGEDFHRRLTVIRSRCPDILRQGHYGVGCQLVDLDLESLKDLRHKAMCGQAKASGEKRLKHDQLALRLGNLLRPRDTPNSAAKINQLLHILHADRGNPRNAVSPGRSSTAATLLKVSSEDESADGMFAVDEEEDDMATYHWRRRAVCLMRARSLMKRSKEGRRAGERFQKQARVLWRTKR